MISALLRAAVPAALALALAACSSGGGALSPGLAQRMDMPGAQLNRVEALGIINGYRTTTGAGAVVEDAGLDATAQQLATQYAKTGKQPAKPAGAVQIRYSAGYFTFAETFSGWRNSPIDAPALTDKTATKAGIAAIYDSASPYGVYWVIVLAEAILDARGLRCPLPVLKMEKRLGQLPAGAELVVLATDPIARIDIPLYCTQNGHICTTAAEGDVLRFMIVKAG